MKAKTRIQFKDVFPGAYETTIIIDVGQSLTIIDRNQSYFTEQDNMY